MGEPEFNVGDLLDSALAEIDETISAITIAGMSSSDRPILKKDAEELISDSLSTAVKDLNATLSIVNESVCEVRLLVDVVKSSVKANHNAIMALMSENSDDAKKSAAESRKDLDEYKSAVAIRLEKLKDSDDTELTSRKNLKKRIRELRIRVNDFGEISEADNELNKNRVNESSVRILKAVRHDFDNAVGRMSDTVDQAPTRDEFSSLAATVSEQIEQIKVLNVSAKEWMMDVFSQQHPNAESDGMSDEAEKTLIRLKLLEDRVREDLAHMEGKQMITEFPQTINGRDGSRWYDGSGVPARTLGENNDYYLDNDTGDYYSKNDGSWMHKGTLTGAAPTTPDPVLDSDGNPVLDSDGNPVYTMV